MSAIMKILLSMSQAAAAKGNKDNGFVFLLAPLVLIALVFYVFMYKSTETEYDLYLIAANEVAEEMETVNRLDGNLVRGIYFLYPEQTPETLDEIKHFIKKFFVRTVTETVTIEGEEDTEVTYKAFKSFLEIQEMILNPPFSYDKTQMALVNLYLLTPAPNGTGDEHETGRLPFHVQSPCKGAVTSYFGTRTHPVTGEKLSLHTGMDISGAHHQPIVAAADGIVVQTNIKKNDYGNYIMLKHTIEDVTFYSFYAHLSELHVVQGQEVNVGEVIGLEGGDPRTDNNPGVSTGHHLHFELRTGTSRNTCFDPAPYVR